MKATCGPNLQRYMPSGRSPQVHRFALLFPGAVSADGGIKAIPRFKVVNDG